MNDKLGGGFLYILLHRPTLLNMLGCLLIRHMITIGVYQKKITCGVGYLSSRERWNTLCLLPVVVSLDCIVLLFVRVHETLLWRSCNAPHYYLQASSQRTHCCQLDRVYNHTSCYRILDQSLQNHKSLEKNRMSNNICLGLGIIMYLVAKLIYTVRLCSR